MGYEANAVQMKSVSLYYSYIRFSTPDHLKGDSQRRQLALSTRYCEKHGLTLDTSMTMKDLGLSAFHGTHISKSVFGPFLEAVNAGLIPRGSYLLIEDFYRLSRMEPLDTQEIIRQILKEGIIIVTLLNEVVYSWERVNLDPGLLYTMTAAMILAHEEPRKKQERLKAAWSNKRQNHDKIMTKICPHWLEADIENNKFDVLPERAVRAYHVLNQPEIYN